MVDPQVSKVNNETVMVVIGSLAVAIHVQPDQTNVAVRTFLIAVV